MMVWEVNTEPNHNRVVLDSIYIHFFLNSYSAATLGDDKEQPGLLVNLIFLNAGKQFITSCIGLALLLLILDSRHPN